jgi:salicylate hydroxylase
LHGSEVFNIVATFHSDYYVEGWNEPGDRDELLHRFRDVGPRPMSVLAKPESWRRWVLCDRDPVETWSEGRVTLLGDAAHPMLQYFAQGACMAMEDAVAIADQIENSDGTFAPAFEAYQRERAPRTGRVQMQARELGEIYHMGGLKRLLRNWLLRRRSPAKYYDGLAWLYGGP